MGLDSTFDSRRKPGPERRYRAVDR